MEYVFLSAFLAIGLMLAMLACVEAGRRLGMRYVARNGDDATKGIASVEGAVFGLLGLLVAFTFSGAAARFDTRRDLIVQEANAIGTSFLRLDLLAADERAALRAAFRAYLDTRLEIYRALPDLAAARAALSRSGDQQNAIWRRSVAACRADPAPAPCALLLPALNEMFDITTTRTMAARAHPPAIIFAMLFGLAMSSALMAGFGMAQTKSRRWLHAICLAAVIGATVYVILDIEYPRLGLIRVDDFDQVLVQLRACMDQPP